MNNNERFLLEYLAAGNIRMAKQYAHIIAQGITSKTDEALKRHLLEKLDPNRQLEIPFNCQNLLRIIDVSEFNEDRFLLRPEEEAVVNNLLDALAISEQLSDLHVRYTPTLMLHGASGTGKTYLAQYIAYKAELPYIYVNFSQVVNSLLGKTAENIANIFTFIKTTPCVLCFDEIDTVAMKRGNRSDVTEMSRVVITLLQELDALPNGIVLIATTNRFDALDEALLRRFSFTHKVTLLCKTDAITLARRFLGSVLGTTPEVCEWTVSTFTDDISAFEVIKQCTEKLVEILIKERNKNNE